MVSTRIETVLVSSSIGIVLDSASIQTVIGCKIIKEMIGYSPPDDKVDMHMGNMVTMDNECTNIDIDHNNDDIGPGTTLAPSERLV